MAVLRVDPPDIEEFVAVKRSRLENFNPSVGVTDAFLETPLSAKAIDLGSRALPPVRVAWSGPAGSR